jgi:translation initiation factor 1
MVKRDIIIPALARRLLWSKNNMDTGIVYSTEKGKMCPACGRAAALCACSALKKEALPPQTDGVVRVQYETHDRKGKRVTVIRGLPMAQNDLEQVARKFKQRFGTGGTVQEYMIEIQGDHVDDIKQELKKQGYTVR